jgi:hypothetical protein
MKVVGKTMDAGATITAHAMRETVSLSCASVLKISYVFITRDEHTFFLCKRLSFRCHTRKYSTFSEDSQFLLYLIADFRTSGPLGICIHGCGSLSSPVAERDKLKGAM